MKPKVNFYTNCLDHLHPFIAARAAAALGDLGDQAAVEPLIAALGHNIPEVRRAAAVSLGKLGDRRAISPLRALAARAESDDCFWAAIDALARLGDEEARRLILDALLQGDERVRDRAVEVIASIGDEQLLEPLKGITEDPDGRITRGLAHALSALNRQRRS